MTGGWNRKLGARPGPAQCQEFQQLRRCRGRSWRLCAEIEGSFVLPESDLFVRKDCKPIPRNRVAPRERTRWEFDDGVRSKRGSDPPGPQCAVGLDDASIASHEGNIYGKSHEEGVHRVRWRDEHGRPFGERPVLQEARPARLRVERCGDCVRHPLVISHIADHQLGGRFQEEGAQKRVAQRVPLPARTSGRAAIEVTEAAVAAVKLLSGNSEELRRNTCVCRIFRISNWEELRAPTGPTVAQTTANVIL